MDKEKRITAFDNIFSQKLDRIVKDIKKIRKDPTKKDRVKFLLAEAKELRRILKKDKKHPVIHTIQIPLIDFQPLMISDPIVSENIHIVNCDKQDESTIVIQFTVSV